jgi:hypothetical protein
MTDADIEGYGYYNWKWGYIAPRRKMAETAVIGEYFHIYRSLYRSHMCAVDGVTHYLDCPAKCEQSVNPEDCGCKVDALATGETTWQNLFPCLINSKQTQDFFLKTMPSALLEDLVTMVATAPVLEVCIITYAFVYILIRYLIVYFTYLYINIL